eukprot:m.296769 g.296769  ORF g.296769 m.296769 type:complete len:102 (-) comp72850_c0_seq1:114-419(-)
MAWLLNSRRMSRSLATQCYRSAATKSEGFGSFHSGNFHELLKAEGIDKFVEELQTAGENKPNLVAPCFNERNDASNWFSELEFSADAARGEFMIDLNRLHS